MSTRPNNWVFASPDGSILLSGHLISPPFSDGAEFILTALHIEHPSLVSIKSNVTNSQTLHSLNSSSPIFTVIDATDSVFPSNSNSSLNSTKVILHSPLLTPTELESLQNQSPSLWSSTFNILLDGPGFALPRWDFESDRGTQTPRFGPLSSPLQRALLSPLLSPLLTNRRSSIPIESDLTIPTLVLGVSRGSISKPTIPIIPTQSTLASLLAPFSTQPDLEEIHNTILSQRTTATAEEIMIIRRRHEQFIRRTKAETELLEARRAGSAVNLAGAGMRVKGFGKESDKVSKSRERSREKSKDREESMERGRKSREDDELISQRFQREESEEEEENRGRSRSRTGRTPEIPLVELPEANELVPQSHHLISIPEVAEDYASRPPSDGLLTPGIVVKQEEVEHETPFEMDEDIDSEYEEDVDSPFTLETELPSSPLLQPSSYRPGSYRPQTNLSSSYAALLSSSYRKSNFSSPNKTPIPLPSLPPSRGPEETKANDHIRQALALDVPSHRGRKNGSSNYATEVQEEGDSVELSSGSDSTSKPDNGYSIGSMPISISSMQPRTFSNTTFDGKKKTDVIPAAASYRPPPLAPSAGKAEELITIPLAVSKSTLLPPSFAGPSSLARSLNNRAGGTSFSTLASQSTKLETVTVENGKNERIEGFVPPHLWTASREGGEELLSRSVTRD